ncbi:hypothetical protein [Vibrio phage BUCT194]|uniref:Uncharacterized protein n=1 Tax=Vibrio phage BUCT194 TaxID=2859072 RepID=A0AAE8XFK8_9CAUD|nr:hypothetical protein PP741_gp034 [Vibrio phage BUCT194]UAW01191.1 hypothetical protein [Vibrio phage BUCT194]
MRLFQMYRNSVRVGGCVLAIMEDNFHILLGWDDEGFKDSDYYGEKWDDKYHYGKWIPIKPTETLVQLWNM